MNPNLLNYAKQNMNNMSHDDIKRASDMMKNMSEKDLQNLMSMTGKD
jgi:hypothetical protein